MVTFTPELKHKAQPVREKSRVRAMPEIYAQQWRTMLCGADAAIILFVSLLALSGGDGSRIAAAVVMTAVVCGVFWACGYYRRSYAVYPRDEVYFACVGVALAALPAALILAVIGQVPPLSIAVALILCALGTSVVRVRLHLERRGYHAAPYAGTGEVSPGAWHRREAASSQLVKRCFDIIVGTAAAVVFSPVMLLAAIAIYGESGGPVFFRQERIGKNGKPFRIFKFRTMRPDAGSDWARPGDDRITRAGAFLRRTSLDELPQLLNVLRGEMSVVGPRPEMVAFAHGFAGSLPSYTQRSIVPPGITGWAQVYLKRNLQPADMPDVLPYDLFYIEHASPLLDAAIVLKTAAEVFFHRAV